MKNYKDFNKVYLGDSDIASLTMRSVFDVAVLRFGKDDAYDAYECFGDDVAIGEHYRAVFEGSTWLMIYDDHGRVYNRRSPEDFEKVTVYRAGEMGCIIHWHN